VALLSATALLGGCSGSTAPGEGDDASKGAKVDNMQLPADVENNAPPRDIVSEEPFTPDSAQGAGDVMQHYFAYLESGRYSQAYALWSDAGKASKLTAEQFAQSNAIFDEVHGEVYAPGQVEGAAGSLYVTVPVKLYGKVTPGGDFERKGVATLRRVNDVPGSTEEQRRWHIAKIDWSDPPPPH